VKGVLALAIVAAVPVMVLSRDQAEPATGQHESHDAGLHVSGLPTEYGQDAFAAISEVLLLLEADSTTDWSKVDLEALRQHLRDMSLVVAQATVVTREIDGGAEFAVSGTPEVAAAAQRMATAHAAMTKTELPYDVVVTPVGAVTTVKLRANDPTDTRAVAKVRGMGFVGWLASGGHHQLHHLGIARGDAVHAH
jgi:hypothetical protein